MPLLTFPLTPVNGQLYPSAPLPGQTQYQWSSTDQTWTIVGTSTGVVAGTYGDAYNVGQFTVDAAGRITFAQDVPIASILTPAGADEEIQFNNNGVFGASADLTWNGTELWANVASSGGIVVRDSRNASNGALVIDTSGAGFGETNIYNFFPNREFKIQTLDTSPITFRNASSSTPFMARLLPGGAAELYHNGSKKFETTSTGVSATGNVRATAGQLQVSNTAQPTFVTGFQAPVSFTQSVVYRLPSGDGAPGNVLSTNGSGLLSWVSPGSATAGGSNTQIQFNNGGVLAGSSQFVWLSGSNVLSVGGRVQATDTISTTGSGYFWSGWNPFAITGSSSGTSVDYGTTGFYRYSTNASDKVLLGRYNPTGNITVDLTLGGDFYLRDTSGNNEFTVTGAGNVFIKGSLQASGLTYPLGDGTAGQVMTTDGAGNLGWLAAAKVVPVPGSQGAPGNPGEIAADASYFYWFDGTNWQRVAAGPGGW